MELTEKQIQDAHTAWLQAVGWEPEATEIGATARAALQAIAEAWGFPVAPAPASAAMGDDHPDGDERAILQVIDERDRAEEALSQAYFLVTGRSPEWSNIFGHKEALEEVDDAQRVLRIAASDSARHQERVEKLMRPVTADERKKYAHSEPDANLSIYDFKEQL